MNNKEYKKAYKSYMELNRSLYKDCGGHWFIMWGGSVWGKWRIDFDWGIGVICFMTPVFSFGRKVDMRKFFND